MEWEKLYYFKINILWMKRIYKILFYVHWVMLAYLWLGTLSNENESDNDLSAAKSIQAKILITKYGCFYFNFPKTTNSQGTNQF